MTSAHKPYSGRIFHRQCVSLAAHGYKVTYVVPARFSQEERLGVTLRGVKPVSKRMLRPLVWFRLLIVALRLRPQVVHFHDPELLILMPFLKAFLGRKTLVIYDVHEYFVDSLADKYWIPRRLRGLSMRLARALERLFVRWVDGIITAVDGLVPLYGDVGKPIAVVRNLPRSSLFQDGTAPDSMRFEGFKLIYAGLILPKRGINTLLEAMRILHQDGESNVHLLLVGHATSEAYMAYIRRYCEKNRLDEYVRWLGAVPHDDVKNYLAGADVGLAPGLMTRQYSNPGIATKVFEYMLCSLPIVSADYPQGSHFIREAQCGYLVPPEDAAEYALAIRHLAEHPAEAVAMGMHGREYALAEFTWEVESQRLIEFYSYLLNDSVWNSAGEEVDAWQ